MRIVVKWAAVAALFVLTIALVWSNQQRSLSPVGGTRVHHRVYQDDTLHEPQISRNEERKKFGNNDVVGSSIRSSTTSLQRTMAPSATTAAEGKSLGRRQNKNNKQAGSSPSLKASGFHDDSPVDMNYTMNAGPFFVTERRSAVPLVFGGRVPQYKHHVPRCEVVLVTYCDVLHDDSSRATLRAFALSARVYKRKYLIVGGSIRSDDRAFLERFGFVILPVDGRDTLGLFNKAEPTVFSRWEKVFFKTTKGKKNSSSVSRDIHAMRRFVNKFRGYFGRFDISRVLLKHLRTSAKVGNERRRDGGETSLGTAAAASGIDSNLCDLFPVYVDIDVVLHGPPMLLSDIADQLPAFGSASPEYNPGWPNALMDYKLIQPDANTGVMVWNLLALEAMRAPFAEFTSFSFLPDANPYESSTYDQHAYNSFYGGFTRVIEKAFNWRALYGFKEASRVWHFQGFKCRDILCTTQDGQMQPAHHVVDLPRVNISLHCEGARNALRILRATHFALTDNLCHGTTMCRQAFVNPMERLPGGCPPMMTKIGRKGKKGLWEVGAKWCQEAETCSLKSTAGSCTDDATAMPPAFGFRSRFTECQRAAVVPVVTVVTAEDFKTPLRTIDLVNRTIQSSLTAGIRAVLVVVDTSELADRGETAAPSSSILDWLTVQQQRMPLFLVVHRVSTWRLKRRRQHESSNKTEFRLHRFELASHLIDAGFLHDDTNTVVLFGANNTTLRHGLCEEYSPSMFFVERGTVLANPPNISRAASRLPLYFSATPRALTSRWGLGLSACPSDISTRTMLINVYGMASSVPLLEGFLAAYRSGGDKYLGGKQWGPDGKPLRSAGFKASFDLTLDDNPDAVANVFYSNSVPMLHDGWNAVAECYQRLGCPLSASTKSSSPPSIVAVDVDARCIGLSARHPTKDRSDSIHCRRLYREEPFRQEITRYDACSDCDTGKGSDRPACRRAQEQSNGAFCRWVR